MFDSEDRNSAIASTYGEGYRILGIFNMRLANVDTDITKSTLRTFSYPNMIETYPSSTTKNVELSLTKDSEPIKYRVFHYVQGDIMMSASMPQSGDNTVMFLKAVTGGKIPQTLPYNDVLTAWLTNLESNSINPGIPALYIQCIIAEMYRSKADPTQPFRKVYGKDMSSQEYLVTNMRGTAAYSSVFASQIFEDMGRMLTTSINMTRREIPQSVSPIEKSLYM
jgi:hypothetical protein